MDRYPRWSALVTIAVLALALLAGSACGTTQSADTSDAISQQFTEELSALADELPNGAHPFDGIVTAAQPSPEQFERLDEAGIRTVINFRTSGEEGTWNEFEKAREMDLNYFNIPIAGAEDLTRQNVQVFDDILTKETGPFLVHCSSSNRVGAMFALRAFWSQEKSPDEALAIGKKAGLAGLEDAVRAKMEEDRS